MEYLEKTLKIRIRYQEWTGSKKLPYMITDRYDFRIAWLDNYEVLFAYVKGALEQIAALKKQVQQIHNAAQLPVVLIPDEIDARRRQQLIDAGIPFVVPLQQIYLPFLGAVLQERYARSYDAKDGLMPSSQLLLLYFIDNKCQPLRMNDVTRDLGVSAMTISRAVRQLESLKLIRTYKDGVSKVIVSDLTGKDIFDQARPSLSSPLKKTVYIDSNENADTLPLAGYSALSEYSMLSMPQVKCYASSKLPEWASGVSKRLIDSDHQVRLEIWHYDPYVLANNDKVGLLPLVLSLMDDQDERVQQSLEEALHEYWEEYDGKRF